MDASVCRRQVDRRARSQQACAANFWGQSMQLLFAISAPDAGRCTCAAGLLGPAASAACAPGPASALSLAACCLALTAATAAFCAAQAAAEGAPGLPEPAPGPSCRHATIGVNDFRRLCWSAQWTFFSTSELEFVQQPLPVQQPQPWQSLSRLLGRPAGMQCWASAVVLFLFQS